MGSRSFFDRIGVVGVGVGVGVGVALEDSFSSSGSGSFSAFSVDGSSSMVTTSGIFGSSCVPLLSVTALSSSLLSY